MTTALQVSVIVPHAMRFAAADLAAVARHVEDVGLDGVFVGDHLAATVPLAESTLVLATAAAATSRIHVGFGVMVLALRHPAWAAKQVATLQQLSAGRVILGVGLGGPMHGTAAWDAVSVPYRARAARTDATLRVLRRLIAGEPTVLDNEAELTLAPGVVPPPVWIGGGSAAARRRAAAHGDAWFPSMLAPAQLAAGATHLAQMCADQGGNDTPAIAIGGSALLGEPRSRAILDEHVAGLVDGYGIPPEMASTLPLTTRHNRWPSDCPPTPRREPPTSSSDSSTMTGPHNANCSHKPRP